ncbi:DUF4394 domain-containing protein [Frankia sp. Ag45/Mut15]|uniref:DUF4394 domain-containing protein n=1 Tax=Frankia umida TaxID=573489 RepID=A0ABT0K124_9ACTN|nr:DUF4394 domain-containing protein [Frankia umida]MCK9876978.1 DUF4394 domain-containing protein [Frankia umida]
MRRRFSAVSSAAVTAALAAGLVAAVPGLAGAASAAPLFGDGATPVIQPALFDDYKAYGLTTTGRLVRFDVDSPASLTPIGRITGLVGGDTHLVGIDFRVQNNRLYGVGDLGGIYVINTANAVATLVSHLTIPLVGTAFGVDFNPAANRLRVISNAGENLRHNLDDPTGTPPPGTTVADTPLTYPPLLGTATGLTGAAYTNNDLDPATGTTLFDINTNLAQVAVQSPANAGTLVNTGTLSVPVGALAGYDIFTERSRGRAVANTGFAALLVGSRFRLYEVNPLTARTTLRGFFPANYPVFDVALPINQ